ncbi:MAG: hypothetical protein ACKORL_04130 [Phycisphaerales bacterium]
MARYARGEDYHTVVRARIEPPLDCLGQVLHAAVAGLGDPRAELVGAVALARLGNAGQRESMIGAPRQHRLRPLRRIPGREVAGGRGHRPAPRSRASRPGGRSGTSSRWPRIAPAAR